MAPKRQPRDENDALEGVVEGWQFAGILKKITEINITTVNEIKEKDSEKRASSKSSILDVLSIGQMYQERVHLKHKKEMRFYLQQL